MSINIQSKINNSASNWRQTVLCLIVLTGIAFYLRVINLGFVGFAEDEINKLNAVISYKQGDFVQNLEHPMLMKLAMTASITFSEVWNHYFEYNQISKEIALRLPNCLLGALSTLVLGFFAIELFNQTIGLIAAAFWATGILSIATNRIGKEDTFLVFFLLFAYFAYFRAKKIGSKEHVSEAQKKCQAWWYTASGTSFGLMLASKYFPHYWGLLFLWEYIDHKIRPNNSLTNPIPRKSLLYFYFAMVGVFLVANFVIWLPATWLYMANYVREETVTHHGYVMMGHLYYNDPSKIAFTGGLPVYFYPLIIGIKTQPIVLIALLIGIYVAVKNIKQSQYFFLIFMFCFWMIPFSMIGAKWMRYVLSVLPIIYILSALGVCKICEMIKELCQSLHINSRYVTAIVSSVCILIASVICIGQSPSYGMYVNVFGGGNKNAGYYFPHDEFYDAGVREAVMYIAAVAPVGASIISDSQNVVKYYKDFYSRPDLVPLVLSNSEWLKTNGCKYVIIQNGRLYFENLKYKNQLENSARLFKEIYVSNCVAAKIYIIEN